MKNTKEISIKKLDESCFTRLEDIKDGCWINMENPDIGELDDISERLGIPLEWLNSCVDVDEKSRTEHEGDNALIIIRIPFKNTENGEMSTIPLGIIISRKIIITVSKHPNCVINDFKNGKFSFYTTQKSRFVLKILERTNYHFESHITVIEKRSEEIETLLTHSLSNKEIYDLLVIQKALIYFSSAITSNETTFEKINLGRIIELFEDDKELIQDIILSNKEIREDVSVLREVLSNTLDAYASIVSNNLNIVMKFLTSMSVVLTVPVFIASLYGMNVKLPLTESPITFWLLLIMSLVVSVILVNFFRRKGWM